MDWKTFISEVISSLAWPAVVIIVIYLLKDKAPELLSRIIKFKYKDTEFEFAEKVKELSEDNVSNQYESKNVKASKDTLYHIATVSPRSAVMEAYRLLEVEAIKAIEKAYPELEDRNIKNQVQVTKMLRDKVLNSEQYFQLRELRNLRNQAAHHDSFSLTGEPINDYIDLALSITDVLERYESL